MGRFVALVLLVFLNTGCSVQRLGIRAASGVLGVAGQEIETESSWEIFRDAVPANIKMMEGLLYVDPNNLDLLLALIKAHAGYGLAVHETLNLESLLIDAPSRPHALSALKSYAKALKHASKYLELRGVAIANLANGKKSESIPDVLNGVLDGQNQNDVEAVFFAGQAWASLINLQRNDVRTFAQLYVAKGLIDWSCDKRPDFQHGVCDIFYGAYDLGRPKMLGGDLERGKKIFKTAMGKYPRNLLIRVIYIEQYVIPALDLDEYKVQKKELEDLFENQSRDQFYPPAILSQNSKEIDRLALFNAIARHRLSTIERLEQKIF